MFLALGLAFPFALLAFLAIIAARHSLKSKAVVDQQVLPQLIELKRAQPEVKVKIEWIFVILTVLIIFITVWVYSLNVIPNNICLGIFGSILLTVSLYFSNLFPVLLKR